jgi:hypothetical protein
MGLSNALTMFLPSTVTLIGGLRIMPSENAVAAALNPATASLTFGM